MSKATTKDKVKQYKTVKVVTLVKIGVSAAVLAAAFFAGQYTANQSNKEYSHAVKTEAQVLVKDLKSSQLKK